MSRNYKNYNIYHLSYQFALDIYKVTENFPEIEKNCLISQMRRAAVSIPANIVEGSTRESFREFLYFLNCSYGSGKELEFMLTFCRDLKFIDQNKLEEMSKRIDEILAKIYVFRKKVREQLSPKTMIGQQLTDSIQNSEERKERIVEKVSVKE